jgi:2-hydroxychromene-2-carboxylate isomerase
VSRLEFFFDCSSPWTYLAFHRIHEVAENAGVEIEWRPILVGGVFNRVNQSVYEQRAHPLPLKLRYYAKDLADWARFSGLRIGSPPVFPVNSVKAMRGAYRALDQGLLAPYARAVFESYWSDLEDISQDDVLERIVDRVGLEWTEFRDFIASQETKDRLRDATDELIDRGGFGSPTLFVDGDDMYFGNDRLDLVAAALAKTSGA